MHTSKISFKFTIERDQIDSDIGVRFVPTPPSASVCSHTYIRPAGGEPDRPAGDPKFDQISPSRKYLLSFSNKREASAEPLSCLELTAPLSACGPRRQQRPGSLPPKRATLPGRRRTGRPGQPVIHVPEGDPVKTTSQPSLLHPPANSTSSPRPPLTRRRGSYKYPPSPSSSRTLLPPLTFPTSSTSYTS